MSRGITGNEFDRYVQRYVDHRSTLSKVQQQYWEAKQTYLQKVKRQEDQCVISADSELDAKLELFKSIEETNLRLLCILEAYQERICILAHEENSTGRFLKDTASVDKSQAGKLLGACGKTLCCATQQRIQLRPSLARLYSDLDTFQSKASEDTLATIERMEKHRTAYRAALLWMKSLSERLDPESMEQLSKFRRVQSHLRRCKTQFDRLSIDCVQKIDMLSASRCNLLSHSLKAYQDSWISFWENSASTFGCIAGCFETTSKVSQLVNQEKQTCESKEEKSESLIQEPQETQEDDLLQLDSKQEQSVNDALEIIEKQFQSFLVDEEQASESNTLNLLDPILENKKVSSMQKERKQLLEQLLATDNSEGSKNLSDLLGDQDNLLNIGEEAGENLLLNLDACNELKPSTNKFFTNLQQLKTNNIKEKIMDLNAVKKASKDTSQITGAKQKNDWLNLFAELDPLANPDAIGKKQDENHNC